VTREHLLKAGGDEMDKYIPTFPEVVREGIIVLGGVLLAAYVLSKMPKVRAFVENNSLTVKDSSGTVLYS
jgi:hypothetical protein